MAVNLAGPAGLGALGALLGTANLFVPGAAYLAPGQMLDTSLPAGKDQVNTAFIDGGFDQFELDTTSVSLTADWDLDEAWSVKSITALHTMEHSVPFDFDGSHQVFINTLQEWGSDDWSQELQLHYTSPNLVGVADFYYLNSSSHFGFSLGQVKLPGARASRPRWISRFTSRARCPRSDKMRIAARAPNAFAPRKRAFSHLRAPKPPSRPKSGPHGTVV
ncbi:MAG: hypothetical protein OXU70_06205 [Gammaproteobacteria bacterium]|nr:hypothetical protein [Gammaproteobacteria bacterium]